MDQIELTHLNLPAMPKITWTTKCNLPQDTLPDQQKVQKVISELQAALSEVYGMSWDEITNGSREPTKVSARFLYYYFLHVFYNLSAKSLGKILGQKHTTALNAATQVASRLDSKDPAWDTFKQRYLMVESKLSDITLTP